MPRSLLPAAALLLLALPAAALPIVPFTDTKTFAGKASDVLVVECVSADAPSGPNGVTPVQVDVVKVLKGDRKTGKTKLATIGQPMEKGRKYLMASFGGNALDTGFLAQADLAVVEIPATFDLKSLDGKTVAEQMQLVFDARREQVRIQLLQLEREKALLEKTAPKQPEPAKPNPPEVTFAGAEVRGTHTHLLFDLVNPNLDPIAYHGYTANAFDPKLPDGTIAPLYKIEYRKGKEWKDDSLGWCGFGIGPVSVANKQKARFDAPVYKEGEWDEVRVGVVWHAGAHGKDPQTAWSKPVSRKDVKKE
jgi:hypothetical protein